MTTTTPTPPSSAPFIRSCSPGALLLLLLLVGACGGDDPPAGGQPAESLEAPVVKTGRPVEPAAAIEPENDVHPDREALAQLTATLGEDGRRVSGRLGGLSFEAALEGNGRARAHFSVDGGAPLETRIQGPEQGVLVWSGQQVDGNGAPTEAEVDLLEALSTSLPTPTLALAALDLACAPGTEELDPALGAALLLPLQMQLLYATPPEEIDDRVRRLAGRSRCQHFRRPTEAIDRSLTPSAAIVALSPEQPFPAAHGYFPFRLETEAP